jgi:hypothetical protein
MPPILRYHEGPVKVDAHLLTELDWLLDMDTAAPRDVVAPLAAHLRDYHRDTDLDYEHNHVEGVHDYLTVLEVDAMQRLRGWHRLRYGTLTVEARWLAEVRNALDLLVLGGYGEECEDYLSQLDYDPAEHAIVKAAVDAGERCYRCEHCQYVVMTSRLDVILDAQGFVGSPNYQAYAKPARDYDPEAIWRERVIADAASIDAGVASAVAREQTNDKDG